MNSMFRYHPRLWISVFAGSAAYFCLPAGWSAVSRLLVSWDAGVLLFLVLMFVWMTRLSAALICSKYIEEDESARFILVAVVCAALLSIAAIVQPLATLKQVTGAERWAHLSLAGITLLASWLLVPTIFTTHYADLFYSASERDRPLTFPNTPMPIFWDFAYFSFTIAAACQTSDVYTTNAQVRRVVIAHTLVSFVFNLAILGFAVNVTAGLIGS